MRILLTNDDGLHAEGLRVLIDALAGEHEITVVAPEGNRSGSAMSVTIKRPLYAWKVEMPGVRDAWAVGGTPVDCVKLAMNRLLGERPDLIISGINPGSNIGINIVYSGTAAAVLEGVFQGVAGMAVSMPAEGGPGYAFTADTAVYLARKLFKGRPLGPFGVNVNMPVCAPADVKGVRVTTQCLGGIVEHYELVSRAGGKDGYILRGRTYCESTSKTFDTAAVSGGWISITPVHPAVTHAEVEELLRGVDFSNMPKG